MMIGGVWLYRLDKADTLYQPYTFSASDGVGAADTPDRFGILDSEAWYAVHLTDGNVYYGTLSTTGNNMALVLTNVFYTAPTVNENPAATTTIDEGRLVLVKLGTEAHRPDDRMVISSDALVFFEKLRSSSPIVKAIESYLQKQKPRL